MLKATQKRIELRKSSMSTCQEQLKITNHHKYIKNHQKMSKGLKNSNLNQDLLIDLNEDEDGCKGKSKKEEKNILLK
jgi:hypothetical protein